MHAPHSNTDPFAHDEEPQLVLGTNKSDIINTGGGPQYIISGNGDDVIAAGGGPDIVEAGNGKDAIEGGGGPDMLIGGNGKDLLIGGAGPDVLTGGNGADIFIYKAIGDAPTHGLGEAGAMTTEADEGPRLETITDFQHAVDAIDLSRLAGVDAFSEGPAAHAVWVEQIGADAIVRIDTNGDVSGAHAAEMSILLVGVNPKDLTAGDFLL